MASPERRPPLDRQLKLLDAAVRRAYTDNADVDAALVADMQGIGSGRTSCHTHRAPLRRRRATSAVRWLTRRAPGTASAFHAQGQRGMCPASLLQSRALSQASRTPNHVMEPVRPADRGKRLPARNARSDHRARRAPRRRVELLQASAALPRKAGRATGLPPIEPPRLLIQGEEAVAQSGPRAPASGCQRQATRRRGGFAGRERGGTGCTRSPARSRTHVRTPIQVSSCARP